MRNEKHREIAMCRLYCDAISKMVKYESKYKKTRENEREQEKDTHTYTCDPTKTV